MHDHSELLILASTVLAINLYYISLDKYRFRKKIKKWAVERWTKFSYDDAAFNAPQSRIVAAFFYLRELPKPNFEASAFENGDDYNDDSKFRRSIKEFGFLFKILYPIFRQRNDSKVSILFAVFASMLIYLDTYRAIRGLKTASPEVGAYEVFCGLLDKSWVPFSLMMPYAGLVLIFLCRILYGWYFQIGDKKKLNDVKPEDGSKLEALRKSNEQINNPWLKNCFVSLMKYVGYTFVFEVSLIVVYCCSTLTIYIILLIGALFPIFAVVLGKYTSGIPESELKRIHTKWTYQIAQIEQSSLAETYSFDKILKSK